MARALAATERLLGFALRKLRVSFVGRYPQRALLSRTDLSMDTRIVARILAAVAISITAVATEPQPARFDVPVRDSAKAEELAKQFAALSPRVDRNEATLVADCAYATVARLRREYRMFGTPIFNNFLVFH